MKVWVVGRSKASEEEPHRWELNGVVSSEEKARAACTRRTHFYAELELDVVIPDEPTVLLPAVYPVTEGD